MAVASGARIVRTVARMGESPWMYGRAILTCVNDGFHSPAMTKGHRNSDRSVARHLAGSTIKKIKTCQLIFALN